MYRLLVVANCALYVLVASGCGNGTPASATGNGGRRPGASAPAAPPSAPAAPPLPPEYRTLATHLAQGVKKSRDEFRNDEGTGIAEILAKAHTALAVLVEAHTAAMDLAKVKCADTDINYIAVQGHEAAIEAIKRVEKIDALPKPPDAGSLFVESFICGLCGNPFAGFARGVEAAEKAEAIKAEVEGLIAAIDKAEAAQLLLPKVARKYASPVVQDSNAVVVDFDESWGCFGPYDWLALGNRSGQQLEDCTIVVELTGAAGDVKKNVHFVREWPPQSWVYARYEGGTEIAGRMVGRTTVKSVQKAVVTIYSPKLSTLINYTYQGAEKDKDIAERCKNLSVRGRYRPFSGGILWDDERAAVLTLDGIDFIPKCKVTVAFVRGSEVKSCYWNLDYWKQGDEKTFATTKGQLTWDPEKIDVSISFPDSSYEWKGTIAVR